MSTCQTSDEHNTSPRGFPARQGLVEGERAIRLKPIKRTIVDGNVDSYGARISISTWALASSLAPGNLSFSGDHSSLYHLTVHARPGGVFLVSTKVQLQLYTVQKSTGYSSTIQQVLLVMLMQWLFK